MTTAVHIEIVETSPPPESVSTTAIRWVTAADVQLADQMEQIILFFECSLKRTRALSYHLPVMQHVFTGLLLAGLMSATPAFAQKDPGTRLIVHGDHGPAELILHGAAADPETPKEGVGIGVRSRFVTVPDAVFGMFVLDHTSFNSYSVGLEVSLDGPAGSRVILGLDYTDLSMPSGNWRVEKEYPDQASYTEVNLHLVSLDAMFLWKIPFAPQLGFDYGIGLGIGYMPGDIKSVDVLPTCQRIEDVPDCGHWANVTEREQEIPLRVIPLVIANAGFYYDPIPRLRIRLDVGFRMMIYSGISIRTTFK